MLRPHHGTTRALSSAASMCIRDRDNSVWLKGSLCAMFDEDNRCRINGVDMVYDKKYGLDIEGRK